MSKPLKALDPETTTATLTEEPVVAGIETGGVGQVVEPLGPKQTSPAAWAGGSAGMTNRDAKRMIGSTISGLMLFFTNSTLFFLRGTWIQSI